MIGRYYTSPEETFEAVRCRRPVIRSPAFSSYWWLWIYLGLLVAGFAAFWLLTIVLREADELRLEQRQQQRRDLIEQIHGECQRAAPRNAERQRACVERAQELLQ